ncbi:hypothetical protein FGO68_gene6081 [Halteria grandinella]|uniref:Cadherin domain-containing protein n=1 Tax=Halteria grandinella TaxID=5974 RepID=A0A8J8P331_HALGN|nr:hypothetical protein FGO68_gene6081 [Halteria grandinella]
MANQRPLTNMVILLYIARISLQSQAPFPKIIGGTNSMTFLEHLDHEPVSGYLVTSGETYDQGVRGDTLGGGSYYPLIVTYGPPQYSYAWGKVFMSMVNDEFDGVKINSQGTRLVVANCKTTRYLIVFDTSNGNLISVTKLTASNYYDYFTKNLLLLDNGQIILGDANQIIKITVSPASASSYFLSSYNIVAVHTNIAQSHIHAFSFGTSICMVTIMNTANFASIYQLQAQCTSSSRTFQACSFEASTDEDTIIFQSSTQLVRLQSKYSTSLFTRSTLKDTSNPSLEARGIYCQSNNMVYSLMFGAYQSVTNSLFIAEVNFGTQMITYTKYLYQISGNLFHGILYDIDKFFIVYFGSQSIKISSSSSFSIGLVDQGVIWSSTQTCQSLDKLQFASVSMTPNSFTTTATSLSYTSAPFTVVDFLSSLAAPLNIVSSTFEGRFASNCQLIYTALSSLQLTNTFSFIIGDSPQTYPITPFTAIKTTTAVADPPNFAYSLKSYNGGGLITVSLTAGDITVSSGSMIAGTYTIVVEGELQDSQTITASFTLVQITNAPPQFVQISGSAIQDVSAFLEEIIDYELPAIVDPDFSQILTVSLMDTSGTAFPSFVDFTDPTHQIIRIQPSLATPVANYTVLVQISDEIDITTYSLKIIVKQPSIQKAFSVSNIGPPIFNEPIQPIVLEMGKSSKLNLPLISDPDGDQVDITAVLKDSRAFIVFNNILKSLSFSPTPETATKATYEIILVLTDINEKPMQTKYPITIQINGVATKNIPINVTEISQKEESDSKQKSNKFYSCDIRIIQIDKFGMLYLKITSSSLVAAETIAQSLNETDLDVRITSIDNKMVQIKIQEVLERNQLAIQLELETKDEISSGIELDQLTVKVVNSLSKKIELGYALLPKGVLDRRKVPVQYSENQQKLAALVESTEKPTMITVLTLNIFIQIFFGSALHLIWGMMNDLSFIIQLSMVSLQIPGIASSIQSILLSIIYMDLLMTEQWLDPILDKLLSPEEADDNTAVNDFLYAQGFKSKLLIYNLGSTMIFLAILICVLCITALTFQLRTTSTIAQKVYSYLSSRLLWGGTIRFVIQQFQPLIMSSIINISSFSFTEIYSKSSGMKFSFSLAVIIATLLLISIAAFIFIIYKGRAQERQNHPLIEGLLINKGRISPYWTVLTIIRWLILAVVLILLTDHPGFQLLIILPLSIASTIAQAIVAPQAKKLERWTSLFNEIMASIYTYTLIGLALATEMDDKNALGLALLFITLTTLIVNLMKPVIQVGSVCLGKCKARCKKGSDKVMSLSQKKYEVQIENDPPTNFHIPIKQKTTFQYGNYVRRMPIRTNQSLHEDLTLSDLQQ